MRSSSEERTGGPWWALNGRRPREASGIGLESWASSFAACPLRRAKSKSKKARDVSNRVPVTTAALLPLMLSCYLFCPPSKQQHNTCRCCSYYFYLFILFCLCTADCCCCWFVLIVFSARGQQCERENLPVRANPSLSIETSDHPSPTHPQKASAQREPSFPHIIRPIFLFFSVRFLSLAIFLRFVVSSSSFFIVRSVYMIPEENICK